MHFSHVKEREEQYLFFGASRFFLPIKHFFKKKELHNANFTGLVLHLFKRYSLDYFQSSKNIIYNS